MFIANQNWILKIMILNVSEGIMKQALINC